MTSERSMEVIPKPEFWEALCQQMLHESVSLDLYHPTWCPLSTERLKCGWLEFKYIDDFEDFILKKKIFDVLYVLPNFLPEEFYQFAFPSACLRMPVSP